MDTRTGGRPSSAEPIDPVASAVRKELHRELEWNHRTGQTVIGRQPELIRVLRDIRHGQGHKIEPQQDCELLRVHKRILKTAKEEQ